MGGLDNSKTKELVLPDVPKYSKEKQTAVANELFIDETSGQLRYPIPHIYDLLVDYHRMQQETLIAKQVLQERAK